MKAISRSHAVLFLIGTALAAAFMLAWLTGYRFNATPSLPVGVYRLSADTPGKGDYAAFCLDGEFAELARERGYLQAGSCPSGLRPLLKIVAGLPGDFIPGDPGVRSADSLGRPLPSILQEGVIPPGMALLLAEHPGSFDSRYFGPVPLASLRKTEPVFLFNNLKGELP
jgi:conjugative transfer signal peptidase TraF